MAGGLAPDATEAPVTVVDKDDVTGFAPALGFAPLMAGGAAGGLIALVASDNNDDGAYGAN